MTMIEILPTTTDQCDLISRSEPWKELKGYVTRIKTLHLKDMFRVEDDRNEEMTFPAVDWTVDFSRNLIDRDGVQLLFELARHAGLEEAREAMFSGKKVNTTENRAALHVALRAPKDSQIMVDNQDVVPQVHKVLNRMKEFTSQIQSGERRGHNGKKIKNVVSIGIGGSNLGPEMACHALKDYNTEGLNVKFVSNVDPTDISQELKDLDPDETLFIIASKTFTTSETMMNARAARDWFVSKTKNEAGVAQYFVAVSTNTEKVKEFGIDPANMFEIWDWVGGRYSMTSAIGLPIMLATSPQVFNEMLEGFHMMDEHYRKTPLEKNVPVIMALLNLWNTSFMGMQAHAVVPYDERLALLPNHLQQLIMESLGKRVTQNGEPVDFATCSVFFGGVGTNVQHSYFELLHQGAGITVPVDFIAHLKSKNPVGDQDTILFANMVAQANVMALGVAGEGFISHQILPGNKPSNIFFVEELNPSTLGQLVALYEHMTHAWGTILGINPFDQFGVEAGKNMAGKLFEQVSKALTGETVRELLRIKPEPR